MHPAIRRIRNEDGMALLLVLLLAAVVGLMAFTAVVVGGNASLINSYEERQDVIEGLADAGLEIARARVNGQPALFPDSAYTTLENGVSLTDATGALIPGVRRWTYIGPTGNATGQFGVFGSAVSVVEAPGGVRVVRRLEMVQESFAKFAYFTDVEPSTIAFGGGDQIQGPVHTNDLLKIYSSRASFLGPGTVTTARTIDGVQYGTFREGYQERVQRIEMPRTAELEKLRTYATQGGTAFTAPTGGNGDEARLRIEFVAIDLNNDGLTTGEDEGFFRVYTSSVGDWMMAYEPGNGWTSSLNCGYPQGTGNNYQFITPVETSGNSSTKRNALKRTGTGRSRCYLGGDPMLNDSAVFQAVTPNNRGQWMQRPFALSGSVPLALSSRRDAAFLFPLSRRFNPNFKGVIHVTGRVAISGVLRGRVTLASSSDIFLVDDVTYANDPGGGSCRDILGLFSGNDIRVADNAVNAPQDVDGYRSFDDSNSEFFHAVVLALSNFTVDGFDSGSNSAEPCESTTWGRGCLYLTGGIIQSVRGAVGTSNGTGYLKRYSYDVCAFRQPPPYYPTTGRFSKSMIYELDPSTFNAARFYEDYAAR